MGRVELWLTGLGYHGGWQAHCHCYYGRDVLDSRRLLLDGPNAHAAPASHCDDDQKVSDWAPAGSDIMQTYLRAKDLEQISHENGFSFVSVVPR